MSEFDQKAFRNALGSFATGVTIMTAQGVDGEAIGMTASSFNSVSLDPPLILWSVNNASASAQAFISAKHFCVNILSSDQSDLSNKFAKSGEDKFNGVSYTQGIGGSRKLSGAICHLECSTWAVYDGGDHSIMVGKVEAFEAMKIDENKTGLVFANGGYATAQPLKL